MSPDKDAKGLTRRRFIQTAIVVGAGGAVLMEFGPKEANAIAPPKKWDKEAGVVIVGTGAAGLSAAIEWQAKEFEKRTGIRCTVACEPQEVVLDKGRTTTLFRVFQETLTNVSRHANATEVSVFLRMKANDLLLQVEDNGRGITEDQMTKPMSFGLIGIRERVNDWGGSLAISGSWNKGTIVTVRIPLGG